jgi:hypothetical protein
MARTVQITDVGSEDDGMAPIYNHAKREFNMRPIRGFPQAVNAQEDTAYTLVASDAGKLVTLDNGAAVTVTLPADADAPDFEVGQYVDMIQLGAGAVTVEAGSGATLRLSGLTADARAQYSRFTVQKIAADTWILWGDLAAS